MLRREDFERLYLYDIEKYSICRTDYIFKGKIGPHANVSLFRRVLPFTNSYRIDELISKKRTDFKFMEEQNK